MRQSLVSLLGFALLALFGATLAMAVEVPRESTFGGQITKIDGQSITLTTGGTDSKDIVLTVNDKTKVRIESAEMVPGDGKEGATRRKTVEGAFSDLKVGQQISATFAGGVANSITVKYVAPPKSPER